MSKGRGGKREEESGEAEEEEEGGGTRGRRKAGPGQHKPQREKDKRAKI